VKKTAAAVLIDSTRRTSHCWQLCDVWGIKCNTLTLWGPPRGTAIWPYWCIWFMFLC